ncbi:MAG TPA: hypothetical protein VKB23_04330 [Solirubrobacterales bacterium]|nr:hypothetical protein [Solirubrobacterales bacterium]
MPKGMRQRLTFANVVSCLALFVALGGGAYAATQLPKNSVGSKQIKKSAVNSAKVKDRSLQAVDFKEGQLPAGPQGLQGPRGEKGERGEKGASGATSVIARTAVQDNIGTGTQSTDSVSCDAGEHLVGGGAGFVVPGTNAYDFPAKLHGSVPTGANGKPVLDAAEATGWRASATNETGSTREFVVVALCAKP